MTINTHVLPRRGDAVEPHVPDPGALEALRRLLELRSEDVRSVLDSPHSDRELTEAATAYLGGAANPLGAAVAVYAATSTRSGNRGFDSTLLADAWIAEHGLAFAAAAVVELSTIRIAASGPGEVGAQRFGIGGWDPTLQATTVRRVLVTASDADYAAAVEALAERRTTSMHRELGAFLVPTRTEWVDEVCAEAAGRMFRGSSTFRLYCAISTQQQLELLLPTTSASDVARDPVVLATLVKAVGAAAVAAITAWLPRFGTDDVRRALDVLAIVDSDECFTFLLEQATAGLGDAALTSAGRLFPARAMRLLADAVARGSGDDRLALRLRGLVLAHPELVADVLPELSQRAGTVVEGMRNRGPQLPDAPVEALPRVLADPPWLRRRRANPAVVTGLTAPYVEQLVWAPGEQAEWSEPPRWLRNSHQHDHDWAPDIGRLRDGGASYQVFQVLSAAPVELLRPVVPAWRPAKGWAAGIDEVRFAASRLGLDVLPILLAEAQEYPKVSAGALLPFLSTDVALQMAGWLGQLRAVRPTASAYFARHGLDAARLVVPAALGPTGPLRRGAETALRIVATRHGADAVRAVAGEYGIAATDGVDKILATDPIDLLPSKVPASPSWVEPVVLPQLLLAGRETAVPTDVMPHVITALALCAPGNPYAGAEQLRETCDPESLAAVGRTLFQLWRTVGMPSKDGWALASLGLSGDDATARMLAPLIAAWPGEGGHIRAVTGVDVLAGIGTEPALMQLDRIARKAKFAGLKKRAQEKIVEVAEGLGLTAEQLADRLVPDFGLDTAGTMTLDYGPRSFTVGFDELLKPFVTDSAGKRLKTLPKPGAKDDPELAPEAHRRFATLKKDVRAIAADQVGRLELAMIGGRRWTGREFTDLFVTHPLVAHLARRLVWARFENGAAVTTFRVAEDGTLADIDDKTATIPDDAEIGIVHPVHVPDELATWTETFADYAILQPFPQLGRAAFTVGPDGLAAELKQFDGITVPTGRVLALLRRGWERGAPQDAGMIGEISNGATTIDLDPGFITGDVNYFPEQKISRITVPPGLGDVAVSELLTDLTELLR
ncbi:DUF4132 domain-containing protein [Pseudonocardia sp. TRM90224]|uniref:DUF4132 domain-containing protein n=1 Tax=Pseudonocardia sp. TRM90224 TaxID=2812678 RepID=UPI001E3E6AA7|nr:DUF4132 domain-containing protein [Pseudonocardia sp. TRM90224]